MTYKKRQVFEDGPYSRYKKHFFIAFYDKTGQELYMIFDNIRQILVWQGKPVTRQNVNTLDVLLYRALNRPGHRTKMLDGIVRSVWLIDEND